VLIASIGSGRLITRYGRYRIFPIVGTALMVVGMLLLSRLGVGSSLFVADIDMLVLGLGLGFVMQVLVLAVQNAVKYAHLGVATSTATLFRSIGGAIGVPIFGAVFANRLASNIADRLPPDVSAGLPEHLGPSQIDRLPPAIHDPYVSSYAASIRPMFLIAARIAAVGFAVTWLLKELPLRESVADQGLRDSFATPREITSLDELETRLSTLEHKHERPRVYEHLAQRAGLDLTAPEAWLLLRLEAGDVDAAAEDEVRPILDSLCARSLCEDGTFRLSPAGSEAAEKLTEVRCAEIEALLDGWKPEEHQEVLDLIERFARSFSRTLPTAAPAAS
jgi:hypothetical protein